MTERKFIINCFYVFLLLCFLALIISSINNKTYYTKIDNTQTKYNMEKDNFEYSLLCYDFKGKSKRINFTTTKLLRSDAYIVLHLNKTSLSWQEIKYSSLPQYVKNIYKK